MRTALAWIIGFAALLIVGVAIGLLGDAIGVPPAIYHDQPIGREIDGEYSESTSSPTSFGYATMIFSVVVGVWAGRVVFARSWWAGFTPTGRLTFLAWLMATAILLPAAAVVDLALESKHGTVVFYIRLVLELGIVIGVGWSCHQWWKNRVAKSSRDQ